MLPSPRRRLQVSNPLLPSPCFRPRRPRQRRTCRSRSPRRPARRRPAHPQRLRPSSPSQPRRLSLGTTPTRRAARLRRPALLRRPARPHRAGPSARGPPPARSLVAVRGTRPDPAQSRVRHAWPSGRLMRDRSSLRSVARSHGASSVPSRPPLLRPGLGSPAARAGRTRPLPCRGRPGAHSQGGRRSRAVRAKTSPGRLPYRKDYGRVGLERIEPAGPVRHCGGRGAGAPVA